MQMKAARNELKLSKWLLSIILEGPCYGWGILGLRSGERTHLPPMWPGLNPGINAICVFSLLLVLSFAPRGFFLCTPVFSTPPKPTFLNADWTKYGRWRTTKIQGCALAVPGGPWHLTFALRWLENFRFFIQIICWAP